MRDSRQLVSIVVLNYNGKNVLRECLESVLRSTYRDIEVIVVDNASTDGSPGIVRSYSPTLPLVENPKNLGYAAGNNKGIDISKGQLIFLINNDIFLDPDCVSELVCATARYPSAGFLQPKILFSNSPRINSAGNFIHVAGFGLCRGIGETDRGQYEDEQEIGFASGAALLFRKEVLSQVGHLDPYYFGYNEDTDWGWRAALFGWKSVYVPAAIVHHVGSVSWERSLTPTKFYFLERNRIITLLKNYSARMLFRFGIVLLLIELFTFGFAAAKGLCHSKVLSYCDIFRLRGHILSERRKIFATREISDERVVRSFVWPIYHVFLGRLSDPLNRILGLCRLLFGPRA